MKRSTQERRQRRTRTLRVMWNSEEFVSNAAFAIVPDLAHTDARLFVAFGWGENFTDR